MCCQHGLFVPDLSTNCLSLSAHNALGHQWPSSALAECSCRFAEAYQEREAEEKKRIQDLKAEIKRHNQEVQDFSYGLYVSRCGRAGCPAVVWSLPHSHLASIMFWKAELRPTTLLSFPSVFHAHKQGPPLLAHLG